MALEEIIICIICVCIHRDAQKCQAKYEKLAKAEKTGANVVKAEAAKKAFQSSKDEFDHQNRYSSYH